MQSDLILNNDGATVLVSPLATLRKVPTESLEILMAEAEAQAHNMSVAAKLRMDFIKAELECRAVVDALNVRIAQYKGRLLS